VPEGLGKFSVPADWPSGQAEQLVAPDAPFVSVCEPAAHVEQHTSSHSPVPVVPVQDDDASVLYRAPPEQLYVSQFACAPQMSAATSTMRSAKRGAAIMW
jgi:hypothetical protein